MIITIYRYINSDQIHFYVVFISQDNHVQFLFFFFRLKMQENIFKEALIITTTTITIRFTHAHIKPLWKINSKQCCSQEKYFTFFFYPVKIYISFILNSKKFLSALSFFIWSFGLEVGTKNSELHFFSIIL